MNLRKDHYRLRPAAAWPGQRSPSAAAAPDLGLERPKGL